MKNKHKRQFLNGYKWWDYCYLLQAIEDWTAHAAKMHETKGNTVSADKIAKKLKIVSTLCKRIKEDDYSDKTAIWPKVSSELYFGEPDERGLMELSTSNHKPDKKTYDRYFTKHMEHQKKQRENDLAYLMLFMKKHMFSFWD